MHNSMIFDTLKMIETKREETEMLSLRTAKAREERIEFDERRSSVCDSYCRANAVLQRQREHVLHLGPRL